MNKINFGIAGVLLAVSGATAADMVVASKSYVDAQVASREALENKKTTLENSDNIGYPTTAAVKTYVDNVVLDIQDDIANIDLSAYEQVANKATAVSDANRDSVTAYPSVGAIVDYVDTAIDDAIADIESGTAGSYQPKSTGTSVGITGGVWKSLTGGTYVAVDDSGDNVVMDLDSSKIANISTSITSGSTNLVTAGAVYNYISNLTGNDIGSADLVCDANHPCTLIDDGSGLKWVRIAQVGD